MVQRPISTIFLLIAGVNGFARSSPQWRVLQCGDGLPLRDAPSWSVIDIPSCDRRLLAERPHIVWAGSRRNGGWRRRLPVSRDALASASLGRNGEVIGDVQREAEVAVGSTEVNGVLAHGERS